MGSALGQFLVEAVAVAISPTAMIAAILLLFSSRPRLNGLAFLAGWVAGLLLFSAVLWWLPLEIDINRGREAITGANLLRVLLGALFVGAALLLWRRRPRGQATEQVHMPKWMATLDQFSPVKSFVAAFLLCTVNPKNFGLCLAMALTLAEAGVVGLRAGIMVWLFVVIGSLTIAFPVVFYLIEGKRASNTLEEWKLWLIGNSRTVMAVMLLMLGMLMIGSGLGAMLWPAAVAR